MEKQIRGDDSEFESPQAISTLRKRFTEEEDRMLKYVIQTLGIHNWSEVSKYLPGRTSRQCRDRYNNYLFKDISFHPWTEEEDAIILGKYLIYGNHWAKISTFLVGRSGNNVKNRWHKYLSKRYGDYLPKKNYNCIQNVQPTPLCYSLQLPQPPPIHILDNGFNHPNQFSVQITYVFNDNPC